MRILVIGSVFGLLVLFAPVPVFLLVSLSTFPIWFWVGVVPHFFGIPWLLLLLLIEILLYLAAFLFVAGKVTSYLTLRFSHRKVCLLLGGLALVAIGIGALPIYGGSGVDVSWNFSNLYHLPQALR
jgi:hypothetical protein